MLMSDGNYSYSMSLTLLQSTRPGSFPLQGSQVLNAGKSDISPATAKTALLRLMGDVLVSCRFHCDSGAPQKFIKKFQREKRNVWRECVTKDRKA